MQDIMNVNRDKLADVSSLETDKMKNIEEKASSIDIGDEFEHVNEDYVVRVFFAANTKYSATDALKDYIKQVTVLKY